MENLNCTELRQIAKERKIKYCYKMRKGELMSALKPYKDSSASVTIKDRQASLQQTPVFTLERNPAQGPERTPAFMQSSERNPAQDVNYTAFTQMQEEVRGSAVADSVVNTEPVTPPSTTKGWFSTAVNKTVGAFK